VRLVGWDGELVLTIFLGFALLRSTLFAEGRYGMLAPLREEHHRVDDWDPHPTFRQRVGVGGEAAVKAAVRVVRSPLNVLADVWATSRTLPRRRSERARIRRSPTFDFGATTSVRELAQAKEFRRYFQQVDREMYVKVVERQIFDNLVEFLREHDIDTGDLEEREAAVLNNGVIVSGGSLKADNLAVGTNARAGNPIRAAAARVTGKGEATG
jgi:hypothetical protein